MPSGLNLTNTRSLGLDGSGDYVDTTDFDLTDNFTIALWSNSDNPAANQSMIGKHTAGGGNLLVYGLYDGKYHLRIRNDWVNFDQTALPNWQHVTVTGKRTGSSTRVRFYLNGNETQTVTLTAAIGDQTGLPWTIGQDWDGGTRTDFFDGRLDDVRIYDRVLSSAEIGQLAAGGDHDGTSWADAYSTLERALGAAEAQAEIWVAGGVNTLTRPLDPADNRSATFQLKPQVDVLGGFAGTETAVEQRDPTANVTVLSGDIDGNDVTDGQGIITDTANIAGGNAFHVVYATGIAPQGTTLDGFTITGGNAVFDDGNFSDGRGGGMYIFKADPILRQLTFQGNHADTGGGLYVLASDPMIDHVTVTGNSGDDAGGMYVMASPPTLTGVTLFSNRASGFGGGLLSSNADPVLQRVTFEANEANLGGGVFAVGDEITLSQATLVGNQASSNGGGIYLSTADLNLFNSAVVSNTAGNNGGGIYTELSSALIRSAHLQGNEGFNGGGGAFVTGASSDGSLIGNAILWGNDDDTGLGPELFINSGFGVTQTTNIISGTQGAPTSNPFVQDPGSGPDQQWGTVDDDHGDLRPLETVSPVNAGTNGLLLPDAADLDGDGNTTEPLPLDVGDRARIYTPGGTVDIGAYERSPFFIYLPIIDR